MNIDDFKDKKVVVMGIGLHGGGVGTIKFFHQIGAKVLATDLRKKEELKESLDALAGLEGIECVLGEHREQDFINADLIIKNPAVLENSKFLQIAKEKNVSIDTDVGIFFELCQGTIIGVSGSRGKSTTASLIYQFLKTKFSDAILAGNIRASVLEKLKEIKKTTLVVLELSSWQLNGLAKHKKSPQVAVLTNIMPDHLNRYESMEEYIADKKIIFRFQSPKDFLILNFDDETVKSFAGEAKSKVYYYSKNNSEAITELLNPPVKTSQEARIGGHVSDGKIYFGADKEKITEISSIKLVGQHNLNHILAALTVARIFDVPAKDIKKTLKDFAGLEGRIQLIKEFGGVKYFNDTTATIPEATIAAINTLSSNYGLAPKRLILIAGGADKNLNFEKLAQLLAEKAKAIALLKGTATKELENALMRHLPPERKNLSMEKFGDMEEAVCFASSLAKRGDIVLLSPACASFGLFRHEFERGQKFNQAVEKICGKVSRT